MSTHSFAKEVSQAGSELRPPEMDPLTREETLKILSCMGIDLPKTTKLPDDVLEKRLRDALNFAQNRKNLPLLESLNPFEWMI